MQLHSWQLDMIDKIGGVKSGEMTIFAAGRQTGKSHLTQMMLKQYKLKMQPSKILWQQLPGRKLKAYHDGTGYGFRDEDMDEVQKWLWTNIPSAKRLSFDTWLFKQDKHVTMVLLRWS